MSTEESTENQKTGLIDTVTPAYFGRADTEMHAIGLLMGGIMLVLLIPLLPFVVVLWAVGRLVDALRATGPDTVDEPRGPARPT